ncbi:chemotaxis protein methyltransferase CheR [Candidatus Magnetomorum sp. HK-1]|nr:chemotaxis protein methyltransferase CheR [Candidatus Magnetomorum sp. HK-1]
MITVSEPEYLLLKQYIEKHCGIVLEKGKEYLIETRLSELAKEAGAKSFLDFHLLAKKDHTGHLRKCIIDAMTTNETSWYRDISAWEYIKKKAIPNLIERMFIGNKIRIWSAAASTGQEAYSLAIAFYEALQNRRLLNQFQNIEIIGTDISPSAIKIANSGRYDNIAIQRGLPQEKKNRFFKQESNYWTIFPEIKKIVKFKEFNLQNSFISLGQFDFILCRYVTIYFSETFKRELFSKFSRALKYPRDTLLLGATESLRGFSDSFDIKYYDNTMINMKK